MTDQKQQVGIIRPEFLASKIKAIRNYEYPKLLEDITAQPRLVEMLWFLQYTSMQPGGLVKFCGDLVRELPHHFGTPSMRGLAGGSIPLERKLAICRELPDRLIPCGLAEAAGWPAPLGFALLLDEDDLGDGSHRHVIPKEDLELAGKLLEGWELSPAREMCHETAMEVLPKYFMELCTQVDKGFGDEFRITEGRRLWFIDDPVQAVFEMMDRQAAMVSKRLAETAVTRLVFDALDYALQERAMVRIEGDSRFGKTESVKTWCAMRPGLARLVSVPSSNSVADLHTRIAEALGIDVSYGSRKQGIRERVEFVLKHSGLFIVLDEGAFLVPQNYHAATVPARLNWVRTEIVDRGLPLAVVVTPQTFMPLVDRYVKRTGYAMEQFFGRNYRVVSLPNELDPSDLKAVAKVHFPEMGADFLELIANMACLSENYLQAVEAIAKLTRHIARREGRKRLTVSDLERASAEILPRRAVAQEDRLETENRDGDAELDGSTGTEPKKAASRGIKPEFKRGTRGVKPESAEANFSPCSLRRAEPARPADELALT